MAIVSSSPRRSSAREHASGVVLRGIRWQTYLALLEDLRDRPLRLTYDRGNLEIMAPSFRHESYATILGRLVATLAEELEIDFKSGRTTTFRRADLERGLEADDCFYFQNLGAILGKDEIDLSRDPPPDLALEIDLRPAAVDRLNIYAALRIPEIWRFDGEHLQVLRLGPTGEYQHREHSAIFPQVSLAGLVGFLELASTLDDRNLIRRFREWVRQAVLPKAPGSGPPAPADTKGD